MNGRDAKTLLMLGGSKQQVVAIEIAEKCGYRTVLCDYLSDNPGQFVADVFYQVSTTDRDAVLDVARKENVAGVLAYASDPAAPTAAYVAETLGLPTNPLQAVETLSFKTKFRDAMRKTGLSCPRSTGISSDLELNRISEMLDDMSYPIVIKPTDSSGSKGVSIVESVEEIPAAVDFARSRSRNGLLIAEEFIARGFPYVIGGDVFVIDGKIKFWGLMSCLRDEIVPLVPVGKMLPSGLSHHQMQRAKAVLQEFVTNLNIEFGELNVELLFDANDTPYLLELGARAGGNMIPLQLSDASGIDLVRANVMCAMGDDPGELDWGPGEGCFATYVLHSRSAGIYRGYHLSVEAEAACYRRVIYQNPGAYVEGFDGADKALGILFFRFPDETNMREVLGEIKQHVRVELTEVEECFGVL